MILRRYEKLSIYVASALIAIHLIRKEIELLIPIPKLWIIFLYALSLPYAATITTYRLAITILLVCWCTGLFWLRLSRRDGRRDIDRTIIFLFYHFLALETYREGSFLANSWLIRWLSRLTSSKLSLATCLVVGLAIRRVTPSYSRNFAYISASARGISDTFRLVSSDLFFEALEPFRRNSEFLVDLIKRWTATCFTCIGCQLLVGCAVKLVKGYFWLRFEVLIYIMLWFIYRNTRDMWEDPRYRRYQAPSEPSVTYPSYSYSPLPSPHHFRLLLLHSRHPRSLVKASLIPFLLEDAPRFEAISYTWGSSEKPFKILIDDKEIPVTANAHRLLRDRSSYLFPCLIWIDTVCIDQDNAFEKTWQVRLMGDIYTKASLITVWLSTSTPRESGFDEMDDNFRGILALYQIRRFNAVESKILNEFSESGSFGLEREAPAWQAISKLLEHSYFERSWIIQEVVLASCVRVMYRRLEIDWEVFVGGLGQLGRASMAQAAMSHHTGNNPTPNFRLDNVIQIEEWRRKRQAGEPITFNDIGLGTKRFNATDLRDKIFAVHAICRTGSPSERLTLPDYSMKLSDVYLNATRRLIEELGICRILYLEGVGYSQEPTPGLESFPTWGVNWSRSTNIFPLSHSNSPVDYCAGREFRPELEELHRVDGTSLFLAVHLFDAIEQLGPLFSKAMSNGVERFEHKPEDDLVFRQSLQDSRQLILQFAHLYSPYQRADQPQRAEELFWRLLIGDRTPTERPAPPHWEEKYIAYVLDLQRLTDEVRSQPTNEDVRLQIFSAMEYGKGVFRASVTRRVCITKNGYVGLVPPYSAVGDTVVVIPGAQTPFVVRPPNGTVNVNKYQLVGECYVHGIMDGEALAEVTEVNVIEVI